MVLFFFLTAALNLYFKQLYPKGSFLKHPWPLELFFFFILSYVTSVVAPPSSPLSPWPHFSSVSLPKRAGLPEISAEHGIAGYSKARHTPSYQGRGEAIQ